MKELVAIWCLIVPATNRAIFSTNIARTTSMMPRRLCRRFFINLRRILKHVRQCVFDLLETHHRIERDPCIWIFNRTRKAKTPEMFDWIKNGRNLHEFIPKYR